jgi:hypothetical protein
MAALPGILGLVVFIYMRPHEFVDELAALPFLYLFLALAALGMLLDLGMKRARLMKTPQLLLALSFAAWCLLTLALRNARALVSSGVPLAVAVTLYVVIAHGIQTLSAFKRVTVVIFTLGIFVASVGVHQRHAPTGCIVINPADRSTQSVADGRACTNERNGERIDGSAECYDTGQPGLAYQCEHIGLFGTSSIGGGRVRYLGVLADPNELALATALAIPFAFAFFEQRRSFARLLLLLATLAVIATEIVYTQSRGGQLVFAGVLGAYFVKRFGWRRGAVVAGLLAIPLAVLGGRSSEEADQSAFERIEAAGAAVKMVLSSPVWGIGYARFVDHHHLTAHNAYLLAAGELGLVGMVLFALVLYVSVKIPVAVLREDLDLDEADDARSLAMAMLAAFGGMAIGIALLSWTYHYVLWIHLGLSGALYGVVKSLAPEFEVKLSWLEIALVVFLCLSLIGATGVYVVYKRAW